LCANILITDQSLVKIVNYISKYINILNKNYLLNNLLYKGRGVLIKNTRILKYGLKEVLNIPKLGI